MKTDVDFQLEVHQPSYVHSNKKNLLAIMIFQKKKSDLKLKCTLFSHITSIAIC